LKQTDRFITQTYTTVFTQDADYVVLFEGGKGPKKNLTGEILGSQALYITGLQDALARQISEPCISNEP